MIETLKTALQGLLASVVRTVVPIVVSFVAAFLVQSNIPVDAELSSNLELFISSALGAISGTVYYVIVRMLEKSYAWASKLLGSSSAPVEYAKTKQILESNS